MSRVKLFNARIVTPYRIINNGCVVYENGKIILVSDGDVQIEDCCEIDVKGNYVSPGFIDIHTHGGGGHDFMDGTVDAYIGIARMHAQHGTTSMLPTTVACAFEELKNTFKVFGKAQKMDTTGAALLGLHLEGPYFSAVQKGALNEKYIKNPDPDEYNTILSRSEDILRWSAAPELEGALEFGRHISGKHILASIGHTDATYEQVQLAFENGFKHITHLYSGMSGVKRINAYRHAGVIESAFLIDEMSVEVIADGVHLPPSLLKLIYDSKGPSKIALVTDSMRAAGMPDGESISGSLADGRKVIVEDGVAKLMDRSAFAGSVATADRLVKTMVESVDIPLTDAIRMMTSTPASIIGVSDRKGTVAPGKDADLVVFDHDINIKMTIVKGNIVCNKEKDISRL